MKKLIILCLSFVSLQASFASNLLPDDQETLASLKQKATNCFFNGEREQERVVRVEIFKIERSFDTLHLAIRLCAMCEKFNEGNSLLENYGRSFNSEKYNILHNYLQNEEIKHEQRVRNNRILLGQAIPSQGLLSQEFLRR